MLENEAMDQAQMLIEAWENESTMWEINNTSCCNCIYRITNLLYDQKSVTLKLKLYSYSIDGEVTMHLDPITSMESLSSDEM